MSTEKTLIEFAEKIKSSTLIKSSDLKRDGEYFTTLNNLSIEQLIEKLPDIDKTLKMPKTSHKTPLVGEIFIGYNSDKKVYYVGMNYQTSKRENSKTRTHYFDFIGFDSEDKTTHKKQSTKSAFQLYRDLYDMLATPLPVIFEAGMTVSASLITSTDKKVVRTFKVLDVVSDEQTPSKSLIKLWCVSSSNKLYGYQCSWEAGEWDMHLYSYSNDPCTFMKVSKTQYAALLKKYGCKSAYATDGQKATETKTATTPKRSAKKAAVTESKNTKAVKAVVTDPKTSKKVEAVESVEVVEVVDNSKVKNKRSRANRKTLSI